MIIGLCLLVLCVQDEYRKPEALLNLERARKSMLTMDMDYWRRYDIGPDHAGSGRPFLRRVTLARDQSMRVIEYGFEGYVSEMFDTGEPASITPDLELHRNQHVWSYKEWDLSAVYHGSHGRAVTSQPDPRTFGISNKDDSRARNLLTAIWQVTRSEREVIRYETSVDGPIHTVQAIAQTGRRRVFKIDAEKGWNPIEVAWVSADGTVTRRAVSELAEFDGMWFPKEINFYKRDGTLFETVKVERLEINRPEHPERLTLADIGVESGMIIMPTPGSGVFSPAPDGTVRFGADNMLTWDGEKVVSVQEYQERLKRGEVKLGPKGQARREQLRQGTYHHPDSGLLEAYNLRKRLRKGAVSEWEAYVRQFIERYQLNYEQQRKAYQILRRCRERADAYVVKHKSELSKDDLDLKRKGELLAGIDRIFEEELKPRLEKLPTRAQRKAADERAKAKEAETKGRVKVGAGGE